MFIPDPGSWFISIPDPEIFKKNKEREKIVVLIFV